MKLTSSVWHPHDGREITLEFGIENAPACGAKVVIDDTLEQLSATYLVTHLRLKYRIDQHAVVEATARKVL